MDFIDQKLVDALSGVAKPWLTAILALSHTTNFTLFQNERVCKKTILNKISVSFHSLSIPPLSQGAESKNEPGLVDNWRT